MDKSRTQRAWSMPATTIHQENAALSQVPLNGFKWEKNEEITIAGSAQLVLVPKLLGDRWNESKSPKDLYLRFAELQISESDILAFANKYGPLGVPLYGRETFADWHDEVSVFNTALNLWFSAEAADQYEVKLLSKRIKPNWITPTPAKDNGKLVFPGPIEEGETEIAFAQRAVVATINSKLAPEGLDHVALALFNPPSAEPVLELMPTTLRKLLWLQLASYLTGELKLKRCQDPKCRKLMNVTESKHANARRFHDRCEERMRKERYRKKLRESNP